MSLTSRQIIRPTIVSHRIRIIPLPLVERTDPMTSHRIMNVACHFVSLGCCLTVVLFGSLVGAAPPPMQVSSYGSSQPVVNQITGTAVAMHHATTDRLLPRKTAAQLNPCVSGLGPAAPHPIWGVDSTSAMGPCGKRGEPGWDSRAMIDWQQYAQGEYVGNARTAHVPSYRLRVDDSLAIYFLRTRQVLARPYELQVGDRIRVESLTAGSSTPLSR